MSDLCIRLMFHEATDRMVDAELLSTNINTRSDAPYLLNLLALEILLKCNVLISTGQLARGHDYATLFNKLPDHTKKEIIAVASERMGPQANYSNLNATLTIFSSNFVQLRYPYEKYDGLTEEQYLRLGDEWVDRGALVEEAVFQYYPNELRGLQHALAAQVEGWLANMALNTAAPESGAPVS